MDSRSRRVNPSKPLGFMELLGAKRESECDIGISKLLFDSLIAGHAYDLQLRKVFAQALCEPLRRDPQVQPVMSGDENFTNVEIGRSSHRRSSLSSLEDLSRSYRSVQIGRAHV